MGTVKVDRRRGVKTTGLDFANTTVAAEIRIRWKVVLAKLCGIPTPLPGFKTEKKVASVKAVAESLLLTSASVRFGN